MACTTYHRQARMKAEKQAYDRCENYVTNES